MSYLYIFCSYSNGDFCFTGTPCTEEQGYPDTDDSTDDANSSGGQDCVPFQVTITADAWPNEISWVVNNIETEELVAQGGNDELVSGEPIDYAVECINNRKGCYAVSCVKYLMSATARHALVKLLLRSRLC